MTISRSLLLTASSAALLLSSAAFAKTEYHVYEKNGECTIETRTPTEWENQRGSGWSFLGKDTTRSGAEDLGEEAGCSF